MGFMVAMPAVTTVQEVQERTQQHEQVRQNAKEMRRMLRQQIEPANAKKGEQDHVAARSPLTLHLDFLGGCSMCHRFPPLFSGVFY
jgi:hypothetical protein